MGRQLNVYLPLFEEVNFIFYIWILLVVYTTLNIDFHL